MGIGKEIKLQMKLKGLNQTQLARKLGLAQNTISNWVNEETEPSIENIYYLCVIFDCDPNELFDWSEDTKLSLQADLYFTEDENREQSKFEDDVEEYEAEQNKENK